MKEQISVENLVIYLFKEDYMKKEYGLLLIHKIDPKHGNCCTCQECGQSHDDCVCEHNAWVEFILGLSK